MGFSAIQSSAALNHQVVQDLKNVPFYQVLSGKAAFYDQPDYLDVTKSEFSQEHALPSLYTWNTEHKLVTIAKHIFSLLNLPKGLHALVGKLALLPASSPSLIGRKSGYVDRVRSGIRLDGEWKYKRIAVEVNGYKIDAVIVGKPSTLSNGRWMLASNGNAEFYEDKLHYSGEFKHLLSSVNSNAIVFNYPGVGASSGLPNRYVMAKAYQAMLHFLEDRNQGIGAREIIGYGHSIGGGVQGDALKTHVLKKEIKYVFIKSRTFSDLKTAASLITNPLLGSLVKLFGWNIDSVESSKKLKAPEIILQTAKVNGFEELKDSSKIIHDGIIPADATLAKALLDGGFASNKNKLIIGVQESHNDELADLSFLTSKIEMLLQQ